MITIQLLLLYRLRGLVIPLLLLQLPRQVAPGTCTLGPRPITLLSKVSSQVRREISLPLFLVDDFLDHGGCGIRVQARLIHRILSSPLLLQLSLLPQAHEPKVTILTIQGFPLGHRRLHLDVSSLSLARVALLIFEAFGLVLPVATESLFVVTVLRG